MKLTNKSEDRAEGRRRKLMRPIVEGIARKVAVGALVLSAGCTFDTDGLSRRDAQVSDAARPDSGSIDAAPPRDAAVHDSGVADASPDAHAPDAQAVDSGMQDSGPVACVSASTGNFSDILGIGTPQSVGGYVFEFVGEGAGGEANISITCGGAAVGTNPHVCPEDADTVINVPLDGKKITIHPFSVSPGATNVSIAVENGP